KPGAAKAEPKADPKVIRAPPGFAVFGFGNVLATNIVKRAGPDKDGKITLEKLLKATETLFKESDKNNDGKLDSTELAAAIAALMPMPKFGPGGPGAKPGPA